MRITAGTAAFSIASCILFFVACSSDDDAAPGGDDGSSSGGTSGKSSSGTTSGNGSSGTTSGNGSSGTSGTDGGDELVPVGDGSLGAGCNKDDECNSKVCSVGHKCVLAPSCRGSKNGATPGIDTCGQAEPGDESCCTSLTLPTTKTRTLDKFEITSGRIRAFIEALPGKNLRKFAKDFAKAHPDSELGKVEAQFPGYLDGLPDSANGGDAALLPLILGAFPQDAINKYDGCFVGTDAFGAATYWQDPAVLKPLGIGYGDEPDGKRKYSAAVLDTKPANCIPPVVLAAFCAWDGGELARPSDYYEVWGHTQETLPPNEFAQSGGKFTKPWSTILKPGEFNWRNGHGVSCPVAGWPGCDPKASEDNPPPTFFSFPKGGNAADDDSPEIGAPGRFPKDVTAIKSGDGSGWMDIGGNLLEAAWAKNSTDLVRTPAEFPSSPSVQNWCNTANPSNPGDESFCHRNAGADDQRPGTLLFKGIPPQVALIGGSFEGHIAYGELYFAADTDAETNLKGYSFPANFQYGKVGGRCARVK